MNCPECYNLMKCTAHLKSESSDLIKTYTHQWWECINCGAKFFGILTEYVFDESLEHVGYKANEVDWLQEVKLVKRCPDSENLHCNCLAHNLLHDLFLKYTTHAWYSYSN